MTSGFQLTVVLDLGAVFLFALTGAWAAIQREYDFIGVFTLALVTGVGGGLLRDTVFIQRGVPAFMQDSGYLWAVVGATVIGAATYTLARRVERLIAAVDALGLGTYAVVGIEKSLAAGLSPIAAILVGMANAVGGGMIRDVLIREEPLLFKPGQYYALAALAGCVLYLVLPQYAEIPVSNASWIAIGTVFAVRMLAIRFNWQTGPMRQWRWRGPSQGDDK